MTDRSFGRTVRFRRTTLGISQSKLGELVGRSPSAVRSWEREQAVPRDAKVLTALSAILGVDENALFEKAGAKVPEAAAPSTIEQALATLDPELAEGTTFGKAQPATAEGQSPSFGRAAAAATPKAADGATWVTPPNGASYVEDGSQRQLYRVRSLATVVAMLVLVIAFVWALSEGLGAFSELWDEFSGSFRL